MLIMALRTRASASTALLTKRRRQPLRCCLFTSAEKGVQHTVNEGTCEPQRDYDDCRNKQAIEERMGDGAFHETANRQGRNQYRQNPARCLAPPLPYGTLTADLACGRFTTCEDEAMSHEWPTRTSCVRRSNPSAFAWASMVRSNGSL